MRNWYKTAWCICILVFPGLLRAQNMHTDCLTTAPVPGAKAAPTASPAALYLSHGDAPYTLPVIFHVIHGGEAIGTFPNLDSGQVYSQIEVLNVDFNGNAAETANYPVNAFVNWAQNEGLPAASLDSLGRVRIAGLDVTFCPALYDPTGALLPEPGIHRLSYLDLGLSSPAIFQTNTALRTYLNDTLKPATIWDPTRYVNIWVTDRHPSFGGSGLATMPPQSGIPDLPMVPTNATNDGIWVYAGVTGSASLYPTGSYQDSLVSGRILTHECGHYLGLRHIWGASACDTDYCDDTPPAGGPSSGSPTYPYNAGSCSSPSNTPDGEMFMNFMDYGDEAANYMFTPDQMSRMQTALSNSPLRRDLGTHGLCEPVTARTEGNTSPEIRITPNPARDRIQIFTNISLSEIRILDVNGRRLNVHEPKGEMSVSLDLSGLPEGVYLLWIRDSSQGMHFRKVVRQKH